MKLSTLFLLLVLLALATFAGVNWSAFMAPATLSFVFTQVQAPLGLVMLAFTGLLTALFLMFAVYLQASVIFEARRATRELKAQRELAEQAEASRYTGLRAYLEAELGRMGEVAAESRTVLHARLDQMEKDLRTAVEQAGNSLAAYVGEIEDRIDPSGGEDSKASP